MSSESLDEPFVRDEKGLLKQYIHYLEESGGHSHSVGLV